MIELFKHNQEAYESAAAMLEAVGKACVIHPTGTGKSFIGFKLCEDNPNKRVLWLAPSEYIFDTQIENLRKTTGGYVPENIFFCTYAKLMRMTDGEISDLKPDIEIYDEYHRGGAQGWGEGIKRLRSIYPDTPMLGLSATNIRYLDNQRNMAEELFDGHIASTLTLGEAIVCGILNPPKYVLSVFSLNNELKKYRKKIKGLKNVSKRESAEKLLEELRRALSKAEGIDEIFKKHITDKTGKYIVFCANMSHMQEMLPKVKAWISCIDNDPHIYTAYSDDPETSAAFADFKSDTSEHIKLLFCINMLNEGIHVDDISGVILLRPTVSPIIYKQQIGRALCSGNTNTPLILDIVANVYNLYSVDSVKDEMQAAMEYFVRDHSSDKIVNDSFTIYDEVADVRKLFKELDDTLSITWEMYYNEARKYAKQADINKIEKNFVTDDSLPLGWWIFQQRKAMRSYENGVRSLTSEHYEMLTSLGIDTEFLTETAWFEKYNYLKELYEETGSCEVKADHRTPELGTIGKWCINQRKYASEGLLSDERLALLKEIHFRFDSDNEISWEENYKQFANYVRTYHTTSIPRSYRLNNNFSLSLWLKNQKTAEKNSKLSPERKKKLEALGVRFDATASETAWLTNFDRMKKYAEENGTAEISNPYILEDTFDLGYWAYIQVKNKSKLSKEQIDMLDSIGFIWKKPLDQRWERGFNALLKYKGLHNNCNVPLKYRDPDDNYSLGSYVRRQKINFAAGKLNKEKIEKLESIGFDFELEDTFEAGYEYEHNKSRKRNLDHEWLNKYEIVKEYLALHNGKLPSDSEKVIYKNVNISTFPHEKL